MNQRNFFVKGMGIFFALLIFWSCSKSSDGSGGNGGGGNASNKVSMKNSIFNPSNFTVTA
jgi:hypothetical protein